MNPWEGMETPSPPAFTTRIINSKSNHNFMWIKDGLGKVGLALSFNGKVDGLFMPPFLENIKIEVQSDKRTITFILQNDSASRQFRIFCEDCIKSVEQLGTNLPTSVISSLIKVIEKWVELFNAKREKSLSKSSELGLIGELMVMRQVMMSIASPSDSVLSWSGPKGHEQDFAYNSRLIEVKCQIASRDKVVTISSLEQLDDISGQIYLSHVGISPTSANSGNCFSLPSLVEGVIKALENDNYAIDTFLGCLELTGYKHDDTKSFESYVESFVTFFKVGAEFPKITRSDVHSAVEKCTYRLNAAALGNWQIPKSQLLREMVS